MSCGSVGSRRYKFINPQTVLCRAKPEGVTKLYTNKKKMSTIQNMFCQIE